MIALTNVNSQYNSENPLLKNISLTINEGEFIVLTGPSGSGKTTLSRIINGLIPHFYDGQLHGQVTINHTSLLDLPMWHLSQWVGSVFQDPKAQFLQLMFIMRLHLSLKIMGYTNKLLLDELKMSVSR